MIKSPMLGPQVISYNGFKIKIKNSWPTIARENVGLRSSKFKSIFFNTWDICCLPFQSKPRETKALVTFFVQSGAPQL